MTEMPPEAAAALRGARSTSRTPPIPDGAFNFASGELRIGSGAGQTTEPIPCFAIDIDTPLSGSRHVANAAPLFAGNLEFNCTIEFPLSPEALEWWQNLMCPSCGIRWADAPPGHTWSAARGSCWSESEAGEDGA